MKNKEWLATLSPETWWDVVHEWLFHEYGMRWNNTRAAVIAWLEDEHKPIITWDLRERKQVIRWE
jgi:hypothetical protein